MPIKCEGCNAPCCRIIGKLDPSLDRGDLCCMYLDEDTCKCKIYAQRPLICNSDLMYDKLFKGVISREEYDKQNAAACKILTSNYQLKENKE